MDIRIKTVLTWSWTCNFVNLIRGDYKELWLAGLFFRIDIDRSDRWVKSAVGKSCVSSRRAFSAFAMYAQQLYHSRVRPRSLVLHVSRYAWICPDDFALLVEERYVTRRICDSTRVRLSSFLCADRRNPFTSQSPHIYFHALHSILATPSIQYFALICR